MANEKFSQFASGGNLQVGDIVVGLRSGVNTQFTANSTVNNTIYQSVRLVSVTQLNATYNNGAAGVGATLTANVNGILTVDGFPALVGDRILVTGQSSSLEDGIYVVTQSGSVGTPYILTRATDFDTPAKIIEGAFVTVFDGFEYPSSIWVVLQPSPAVIGVNNIILSSTMEQALIRFDFLQSANDLSDVQNPLTAFDNLSPVNTKGSVLGFNGTVSAELSPGANGQVLTADSTQTLGFKWDNPTSGFAFTAKGQLITYDGTNIQYENVGSDFFVLTADSTQTNGIKWAAVPNELNFTAKGQLVTFDGFLVQYENVGADNFVLTADSTQPNGLKWAAAPPPSFTYPYTFTGNNVLFDFAPTMNWATADRMIYSDGSKNLATNNFLQYFGVGDQLLQGTSIGSVTNSHVAALATNNVNLTANYTFVGASDSTSISSIYSAIEASSNATIGPLGDHSFIAASTVAFIDNSSFKCVIMGTTGGTINSGSATSGIFCGTGSITGSFDTIIGADASSVNGTYSSIIGGQNNSMSSCTHSVIAGGQNNSTISGINSFIAGGQNNTLNGDHNFIAAADGTSANGQACVLFGDDITCSTLHAFAFNDGVAPITPNIPNSFSIVATRGVAIGGTTPGLSDSIRLQDTNKALRLNNVAGTGTITNVAAGHIMFDTTTNQFMGYNGTAWVILG